jgi:16S rRNA processing protein RimM
MVVMGHLGAPFGVKGWVNVHTYTSTQGALLEYSDWWLGRDGAEDWRRVEVAEADLHRKGLTVRLEGCNDREAAARLKGLQVAVRRQDLLESGAGEYYWADLVGLTVINRQGVRLGTVSGLIETGANDVLEVRGEKTRLIPFIPHVIDAVDCDAGRIEVDWGEDY